MRNEDKLKSFTEYCKKYPEQRFWQALRNWAREDNPDMEFILYTDELEGGDLTDTFYLE